jgi:hypothetical protein
MAYYGFLRVIAINNNEILVFVSALICVYNWFFILLGLFD